MIVSHPDESKGSWSILGDRIERVYPSKSINLPDNIKKIDVFYHSEAVNGVAGRDGLPRAAAGAVLGFLIAGPVGTVLGAGAGATGANAGRAAQPETYSITITFKNGQHLIGDVSLSELEQLRRFFDASLNSGGHALENAASKADLCSANSAGLSDLYEALPEPIKGRLSKQKPFPISKLTKKLGIAPDDRGVTLFFRHLQVALDSLNTIKWRHYNQEIHKDLEIAEVILVALSATSHQIHQLSSLSDTAEDVVELLVKYFTTLVPECDVRKAWSKPKPSSIIAKVPALKILKKCRSLDPEPGLSGEPEVATSQTGVAAFNTNEIEKRLLDLKDLLDRGLISEDEHRAARLKSLGI